MEYLGSVLQIITHFRELANTTVGTKQRQGCVFGLVFTDLNAE